MTAAMTPEALDASHWFRVAPLRPFVARHVQFHRHVLRGEVWYVAEDRSTAKFHRFNPAAWRLIAALDGRRTLQQVWETLAAQPDEHAPTQEDVLQILGQLHAADLLVADVTPDVQEILQRRDRQRLQRLKSRFANPLSLRFPLIDPDRLLGRLHRLLQGVPAWLGVALWLVVVLPALLLVPPHWPELTRNFTEQLLGAHNLLLMLLVFPLLKAAHELAHGLAAKAQGGEVHEAGVMLLLFYPVPYVDVSCAHAFADKRRRMLTSAAGMLAEVALAALAFYAWLLLEPGLARAMAYNVVVLGSITTVLFNANPLLRFDGYYLLADAIEVPNLGQRANQYWQYLATRYAFGVAQARPPLSTRGERRWFLAYAPLALLYRLSVTLGIAWVVVQHYFFFGVLMAVLAVATGVLWPLAKAAHALATAGHFVERRGRVVTVAGGGLLLLGVLLFGVPVPHHTRAHGVVSLPEQALLRSPVDGFVQAVAPLPAQPVAAGWPVMTLDNAALRAEHGLQAGRLAEAEARLAAVWGTQPAEAERLAEDVARERAALARLQQELQQLDLRAQVAGRLWMAHPGDLPGRFVRKGEMLGHVLGPHGAVVQVVVRQDQVDRVLADTRRVEVRLPQAFGEPLAGTLVRATPKASTQLPGAALGQAGGGAIATDPADEHGTRALERWFQFDVALPQRSDEALLGSRAYVSFEHAPMPLGLRALQFLRRQFLTTLHV